MLGDKGGPAHLAAKVASSWYGTVGTVRHSQDARRQTRQARHEIKAPLCTEYISLCTIICCSLNDVVMRDVLFVYLQDNKSYGS